MKAKEMTVKPHWKRLPIPNSTLSVITILLLLAAFVFSSCYEEDMTISIDERNPPTFKLSGSGNLAFFGVWEVAPENQRRLPSERDGDKDLLLWQIWPNGLTSEEKVIRRLPAITYGSVPTGFVQKTPLNGAPPALVEGKVYEAGGPASNANGGFLWFKIQAGKIVKVDAPGGN